MSALRIELPDELRRRMQERAIESGFDSIEAYAQAVLIADATDAPGATDDQIESLLLGRLDGPFVNVTPSDFERIRVKLKQRLGGIRPGQGT